MRCGSISPYRLQGAIHTLHDESPSWNETDWPPTAALHGVLARIDTSPVVAMDRAVAVGEAAGRAAGFELLAKLDVERVPQQQLPHVARGELLLRSGRGRDAVLACEQALLAVASETERRYLERRIAVARDAR